MNSDASPANIFSWNIFDEFFSIAKIMESQRQYQTLVLDALQQISNKEDKVKLINLLDLRLITLLELIDGYGGSYTDESGALVFDDTIAARLEINNSICWSHELPQKRRDRFAGLLEQYEL